MSKKIAHLLSRPESEVSSILSDLEKKSGYPSEDVRLLVENKHRLRTKLTQIGLDPDDTTDQELYYALFAKFQRDGELLDQSLGIDQATSINERINRAVQIVSKIAKKEELWVLKKTAAKKALLAIPPRQVAKKLGYRSVASLIKREHVAYIYILGLALESISWQKNLSKQVSKFSTSDYELRGIELVNVNRAKIQNGSRISEEILTDRFTGTVAIWPSQTLEKASVLSLALMVLTGLESLGQANSLRALCEFSPALEWWADCNFLISEGGSRVSLNLKDVAHNYLKNLNIEDSVSHHGANSLWLELTGRYKKILSLISDDIPNLQVSYNKVNDDLNMPMHDELATEYVTLE